MEYFQYIMYNKYIPNNGIIFMEVFSMLLSLLSSTAWEMIPPKPYGAFHLLFFFGGMIIVTAVAWLLRNTNERQNKIVLWTAGGLLLIFEVYKQLFYTYVIGGGEYQWWIFPFQLCSVPMYLCIIAPFLKEGKVKDSMYDFMLAFNMMGGFISFLEPSGLIHEYWTLTLHAFVWHLILVFVGLYLGFSKRAGKRVGDYRNAVRMFFVLCVIAFAINLIFWQPSAGTIKMFYIGPAISPIIVFKTIATKYGWYVNTPIYMFALCLGAFIFYFPFAKVNSIKQKNTNSEDKITYTM